MGRWGESDARAAEARKAAVGASVRAVIERLERRTLLDAALGGILWNDADGDGTRDAGEAGLAGRTVYLDANLNRQRDAGEMFTTTDGSGAYAFTSLPGGAYFVAQVLPIGWEQTAPTSTAPGASENLVAGRFTETGPLRRTAPKLTTTASDDRFRIQGEVAATGPSPSVMADTESSSLIRMPQFRADPRFAGINGSGQAVVIIDTGIDLNHPFFGADADGNGVADRIVYQWDFADNDASAQDFNGHGSLVSSLAASQDTSYDGVAPGANIIALKVFAGSSGTGSYATVEQALQWVVANAEAYNVAAVNMSLGSGNYAAAQSLFGLGDELAALAGKNIIVAAAAGNSYFTFQSPGVSYPAADANALAIGAVYDQDMGAQSVEGSQAYVAAPDRVAAFSQRSPLLLDLMAPGARVTGANANGGTQTVSGTSAATPYVTGLAALAQQMAMVRLGRRLTPEEFRQLMRDAATPVYDGDDEYDNVPHSQVDYYRVDALRMGEILHAMAPGTTPYYPLGHKLIIADVDRAGVDFGSKLRTAPPARPALNAISDTGRAQSDNWTNLDNSSPSKRLTVYVPGVIKGATVELFANGVLVGSAVATGTTGVVVTDGVTDIPDGVRLLTARQTFPGGSPGPLSASLSITVDNTPPAVPPAPDLAAASDTGVSSSDNLTADDTPSFTFASTDNFYRFYRDGVSVGVWDYDIGTSIDLSAQGQGVRQYMLGALDGAGNETQSSPLLVTIDSNAALGSIVPGNIDSTFAVGGAAFTSAGVRDVINAVARQDDGKIVAAGSMFETGWLNTRLTVWRFNPDGTPDSTFGTGGRAITPIGDRSAGYDVHILPGGKILVGGVAGYSSGGGFFQVRTGMARFTANGSLDTSFGSGGTVFRSDLGEISAMIPMPDGKIVASIRGTVDLTIARFNANGTLDTSFGAMAGITKLDVGGSTDDTDGIALQSDGRFVVIGSGFISGTYSAAVARFTAAGLVDSTFDGDGKLVLGPALSWDPRVAVQPDGKILALYSRGGDGKLRLTRLNGDGSADGTFAAGGDFLLPVGAVPQAGGIIVQEDGRILLGAAIGNYLKRSGAGVTSAALIRLNTNGSLDNTFGGAGIAAVYLTDAASSESVRDILLQPDGSIVMAATEQMPWDWQLQSWRTRGLIARFQGGNGAPRLPLDLQPSSDTGASSSDNLTSDQTPTFDLPPLYGGYARLYRGGAQVVGGYTSPATWTPDGTQPEGPMLYGIGYVDTAGNESPRADLTVTVDTVAPTGTISAVPPVVQTALDSITFVFSEPVYGFDISDLVFMDDGVIKPLSAGATLSTSDNITWMLAGLSPQAGQLGTYRVNTSTALMDAFGHPLDAALEVTWGMNAIQGGGGDDVVRLSGSNSGPGRVDVRVNGQAPYVAQIDVFSEVVVFGGDGDDELVIDRAAGTIAYSGTIMFDGGGSATAAGDELCFLGAASDESITYAGTAANLAGTELELSNVEGLLMDGGGGNDSLIATGGLLRLGAMRRLAHLELTAPATLDLLDGDLVVSGDSRGTIEQLVATGRLMASSADGKLTGLAVASAGDILNIEGTQTGVFSGQTVTESDVLVKFTYAGDANLDGKINIDDYGRIDGNVAMSGSVFGWFNGDFSYDGKINIDDYGIIDGAINAQGAPL